mmetsp:Transcript_28594/g.25308  ORF Transcript_28594/g.25308 Transcript_28594/m.25308 type:complete len:130 (+) Transcript_28594:315-704(+)
MIKATGLTPHAGIMTLVFDEQKFPYRIPISIINEPEKFSLSEVALLDDADKPEEEDYAGIKIRSIGEADYEFDVSNYTLINELKVKYMDEINKSDFDLDKVIFLYGGKRMNDKLPLYSFYSLKPGYVIQ